MRASLPRLSVVHLQRRGSALALLIAVAVLLELAAGTGLTYLAGFDNVRAVAGRFDGFWLFVVVGALLISIVGYYLAYQGIFRVEGGPRLSGPQMRAVVAAGFGGFLATAEARSITTRWRPLGRRRPTPRRASPRWAGWSTACSRSEVAQRR